METINKKCTECGQRYNVQIDDQLSEDAIIRMANKTIDLCDTERRLIKEAAVFMWNYQYVCPHNDTNFTFSKVQKWIKEFKQLEKEF